MPTRDDDIDFIHQVDGPRLIGGRWWVGQRFPLHASSSGKVLLAEPRGGQIVEQLPGRLPVCATQTIRTREALVEDLDGVRKQGYAITRDELEDGLLGIFRAGTGRPTGAVCDPKRVGPDLSHELRGPRKPCSSRCGKPRRALRPSCLAQTHGPQP